MKFGSVRVFIVFIATLFAVAFAVRPAAAQSPKGAQSTQTLQSPPAAQSTQAAGTLRGTITDPSGAAVQGAAVVMMSVSGQFTTGKTNQTGGYEIKGLAPGSYTLTVNANGFAVFEQDNVRISPSVVQTVNATLALAAEHQSVQVSSQAVSVAVNPEENASAVVIQGKDLEALSDDPDELQDELTALAGPSAGPNGGQMYIDGFQAGQLPPKSAIREIIINQNPFSAEYPDMGFGRIQILTKPGTNKLHGDFFVIGNDSVFNTLDPFIIAQGPRADVPPNYHTVQFSGDVSGPLSKKASYFIQVEQRNIDSASVIDASFTCAQCQTTELHPQTRTTISPRIDLQLSKTNTITIRYQYTRSGDTNDGVGQFRLPSLGYNESENENTLQVTDDQTFGTKVLTETRFQYNADDDTNTAQTFAPEITVPGALTTGGDPLGRDADKSTRYELDSFTQLTLSKNTVRFGARLDEYVDNNNSTSGFNGTFEFANAAAYQTYLTDSADGMTDAQIVAAGGGASQYSVVAGNPAIHGKEFVAGLYAEDDWHFKPSLTLSYGLRYEIQTNVSDHNDWAPRLGLSWGVGHGKNGPRTVLRAGYGIFYNRFNLSNTIQADRLNGTTQQQYVVTDPDFFPTDAPAPSTLTSGITSPTIYQLAPGLRAPYQMELGGSVEQQLTKSATLSLTYLNSHGMHQFLTDNVNAPLPGTYNPADPSAGVRPLSAAYGTDNVYQYQSEGIFHQNQLIVNLNYRLGSKVSLFGYYTLNYANSDTGGIGSFPSNPYNLIADYGRASFDVRNRVFFGGTITLPKGFRLNPLISAQSGQPFNISVGQDLNGDSIFNDRPGIAKGPGPNVIPTAQFGYLDADPIAGEALIPINDGTGPGLFTFNLRISKTFSFGGEPQSANNTQQGGGRGGPGGGPGGFGGGGGGGAPGKRYSLTFSANIRNLFNIANVGVPNGVLTSSSFDKSNSMAGGQGGGGGGLYSFASSDRRIDLQMIFNF